MASIKKTNGRNDIVSHMREELMKEELKVPRVSAQKIVDIFISYIKERLIEGESVLFKDFGKFHTKERAAKKGRDIQRGKFIHIPASFIPAFKPAQKFVDTVKANEKHLKSIKK